MDELVQFLCDRLDEDQKVAGAAGRMRGGQAWEARDNDDWPTTVTGLSRDQRVVDVVVPDDDETVQHIARHDPARVLAEVDAKRQLLGLHGRATLRAGGVAQYFDTATVCRSCEPSYQFPEQSWPCPTLRLLALPYADHPDYREEWRP